jgi:hypothetical protein
MSPYSLIITVRPFTIDASGISTVRIRIRLIVLIPELASIGVRVKNLAKRRVGCLSLSSGVCTSSSSFLVFLCHPEYFSYTGVDFFVTIKFTPYKVSEAPN